ncbi:hypothetical protein CKAH01_13453 [Colletotrichum kahawae]|uniref:SUR7 protein n=1 Tax=Colletotrichum kahawae TaxID=34407 RepID=A0AAD9YPZ7_COLKA|nr:hypothetical protein CKAH01_13453 [Colletotrichum kahawae]
MFSAFSQSTASLESRVASRRQYRRSALLPAALSIISFSLTLVLVLSGRQADQASDVYFLSITLTSLNQSSTTSRVIQAPVQYHALAGRSPSPDPSPTIPNPLEILENPIGALQGVASSIPNPLVVLENPAALASLIPNPVQKIGSLESAVPAAAGAIGSLFGNITHGIEGEIQVIEKAFIDEISSIIGIKNQYTFYVANVCMGMPLNESSKGSSGPMSACPRYSEQGVGVEDLVSKIPTKIPLGVANITIPFSGQIADIFSSFDNILSALGNILFAFYIIALVGNALLIISSISGLVFRSSKLNMLANILISLFATGSQISIGVITVTLVLAVGGTIGMLGRNLGIHVEYGAKALAFIILSTLFTAGAGTYWFAIAFRILFAILNHQRQELMERAAKTEKIRVGMVV